MGRFVNIKRLPCRSANLIGGLNCTTFWGQAFFYKTARNPTKQREVKIKLKKLKIMLKCIKKTTV